MATIELLRQVQRRFPCRVNQIRDLYNLYNPSSPFPRTVLVHGIAATGKTSIVRLVLGALGTRSVYINAKAAISARQVWEEIYRSITSLFSQSNGGTGTGTGLENGISLAANNHRVENLSILVARLEVLFRESEERVVIVLDGVDEAKELAGYMPGVARLGEIIPCLSVLAITTTAPHPSFLRAPGTPQIHFPTYTKSDALHILSTQHILKLSTTQNPYGHPTNGTTTTNGATPTAAAAENNEEEEDGTDSEFTDEESNYVYVRFLSAVWDTFIKPTSLSLTTFRNVATELWQPFIAPILARQFGTYDVAKLIVYQRPLFQRDVVLVPSIISTFSSASQSSSSAQAIAGTSSTPSSSTNNTTAQIHPIPPSKPGTGISLPPQLQKILTAAYLASYIPSSSDIKRFSRTHPSSTTKSRSSRKSFANGGMKVIQGPNGPITTYKVSKSQNRKIPRMLLPPSTFSLERLSALLATLSAASSSSSSYQQQASTSDLLTAISTLCSLRLLLRTPAGGGTVGGAAGTGGTGGTGTGTGGGGGGGDVLDAGTKYRVNVGFDVVRLMGRRWGVEVEEYLDF